MIADAHWMMVRAISGDCSCGEVLGIFGPFVVGAQFDLWRKTIIGEEKPGMPLPVAVHMVCSEEAAGFIAAGLNVPFVLGPKPRLSTPGSPVHFIIVQPAKGVGLAIGPFPYLADVGAYALERLGTSRGGLWRWASMPPEPVDYERLMKNISPEVVAIVPPEIGMETVRDMHKRAQAEALHPRNLVSVISTIN